MGTMKNIFSLVAMLGALTAFGAFQYDISNDTIKTNDAGYFEILQDSVLNISYYSPWSKYGQDTSFGYFIMDSEGNILSTQELTVTPNATVSTLELKAGDKVGFWLKSNKTNETIYSVSSLNSGGRSYFDDAMSKKGDILFNFGDKKWDGGVLAFSITSTSTSHTGQPLPGVLATLLLGGGTLVYSRMRRAKAKAESPDPS